jgi:hypothetical protein
MPISDQDVIIHYARIIHRNCRSVASFYTLARFLWWLNVVDNCLPNIATGWLPSQSALHEPSEDHLQESYNYYARQPDVGSVHLAIPVISGGSRTLHQCSRRLQNLAPVLPEAPEPWTSTPGGSWRLCRVLHSKSSSTTSGGSWGFQDRMIDFADAV